MHFQTFATDGDYDLEPTGPGDVTIRDRSMVKVTTNIDGATVTFGCRDESGVFSAFTDGEVVQDSVVNHGFGVHLMVSIAGIISNPVTIGWSA